ncbi:MULTISPECIES: aminoglycoside 6-adenylyltransferase [Mammaliicoccus]|uniref:aminoglycoside 6-adenylyltransferase n=1 Tax=Mammaliicoccus TaxID=2803850 RepID=UPI000E04B816|nr:MULTISPECIES: aminoglycoside 6-adenylyltransferase [Mammaliicoccus]RIL52269.1 streptomycin resistance protein [Mammaliicoccus fleurettii]RTX83791.1 streptomycin resistance protein [Mammaliicoccus fleurettii]SUM35968.1 Aminoglycoside 6-adenylyltransferase [Mammaliicoccus fleurettii]HCN61676.1 streptomycin resistance protein [Staphylococcus sp.]
MFNQQDVFDLITDIAKKDNRIECVLLNGSRANPNSMKDQFQDYDIIFSTKYVNEFVKDKEWHKQFGDTLIMQTPDYHPEKNYYKVFGYLLQFKNMIRIDLRLMHPDYICEYIDDAYSKILLDKTGDYNSFNFNKESQMYYTKLVSEYEFNKIINEIYWVSTYVIKGIARKDFMYAEYMLSNPVKTEFIKLIKQFILSEKDIKEYNFGKVNQRILEYEGINADFIKIHCNNSLETVEENIKYIIEKTHHITIKISKKQGFRYNKEEYEAVKFYMANILSTKDD